MGTITLFESLGARDEVDPRYRLQRRYPGEGKGDPRFLARRIGDRVRDRHPDRTTVGDTIHLREAKVRESWRKAHASPNAPLLKRLVRYPFRLHTSWARRSTLFEPASATPLRVDFPEPAMRVAIAARGPVLPGNPLRGASTGYRPGQRGAVPTVDEWLTGGKR